ncbi:nucleotidyltransferase domain-containing protein [Sulfurivirga caldicuralii]|nr:nucleotidyltransferase domain-containing protein [Sulfurivirga caldicuralii]
MTEHTRLPLHTRRVLLDILRRFPAIEAVWLFGSRARGSAREGSDIDLVVSAPTMSEADFARLWDAIDGSPIAFKVDLLHWERLDNPTLRAQIQQDRVQIYP